MSVDRTTFADADTGTDSGVTVTEAAASGKSHIVKSFSASSDAAALYQVKDGTTVIWAKRLAAAGEISNPPGFEYRATAGAAVSIVVSASTSNCEANISGETIP